LASLLPEIEVAVTTRIALFRSVTRDSAAPLSLTRSGCFRAEFAG
jgi:hypothetical protein